GWNAEHKLHARGRQRFVDDHRGIADGSSADAYNCDAETDGEADGDASQDGDAGTHTHGDTEAEPDKDAVRAGVALSSLVFAPVDAAAAPTLPDARHAADARVAVVRLCRVVPAVPADGESGH